MMVSDESKRATRAALFNAMLAEVKLRFEALQLKPVARVEAEDAAFRALMYHVALLGRETEGSFTPFGLLNRVSEFWTLWMEEREKIVALVPVDEATTTEVH